MSLWIETFVLTDRSTGDVMLSFRDPNWSLDSAEWLSDSVVALKLRKYPGNHHPAELTATVDCAAGIAQVDGAGTVTLEHLERALDRSLTWESPEPGARGLRGLLRRLFERSPRS